MAKQVKTTVMPSFLDIVQFVLDGPAFDGETYNEGVRVFTDVIMTSHTSGAALLEPATQAAIEAAVVGYPDPEVQIQEAWARYDQFMIAHGAKPQGKVRRLVQDIKDAAGSRKTAN